MWIQRDCLILRRDSRSHAVSLLRSALPLLVAVVVLLGACPSVTASDDEVVGLDSSLSLEQYAYRNWSMADGLPSNRIHDLVQCRNGYLWVATERGLARFDGLKFTSFNRSNATELPSNRITSLYESSDGTLWVGTRGGLARCSGGPRPKFRRVPKLDGETVSSLCKDSDGRLWIGTPGKTWMLNDDECLPRDDAPLNVTVICRSDDQKLYLASSMWFESKPESFATSDVMPVHGLYRLQENEIQCLTGNDAVIVEPQLFAFKSICPDGENGLWIAATRHGLIRFRNGKCEITRETADLKNKHVRAVFRDHRGDVWYAPTSGGLKRVGDSEQWVTRIGVLSTITQGREGHIWFGTTTTGLYRVANPELTELDVKGVSKTRCLVGDSRGNIWLGSGREGFRQPTTGVHRLTNVSEKGKATDQESVTFFGVADGLPHHQVSALSCAPDDTLWIGTYRGLASLTTDGQLTSYTTADGMARNWLRAVYADRDGAVWVGFSEGRLQRFDQGKFTMIDEFGDADVNFFHQDRDGRLWVGSNRGLFCYVDGRLKRVENETIDRLPIANFSSCYEDGRGQLWIGTEGSGLCRFADNQWTNWTSADGLHEDMISLISEDADGNLILGGPHGLSSVPQESFDVANDVAHGRIVPQLYGIGDGSRPPSFASRFRPNALRRKDGSVWLAADGRVFIIPANGRRLNASPPLAHIEDIRVDNERMMGSAEFEIRSDARYVDFHYAATSYATPEQVTYRYQLDGFDDGWIDAGTERKARYVDLPPGEYVFRVQANNGRDVWSEEAAVASLVVTPQWWETAAFRALAVIGLFALTICSTWGYTRSVRRRNAVLRHEIDQRKRLEVDRRQAEAKARSYLSQLERTNRASSMGEMGTSIAHEVRQPLFAMLTDAETGLRILKQEEPDLEQVQEALEGIRLGGNRASEIIDRIRSLVQKVESPKRQVELNKVAQDVIGFVQAELREEGVKVTTDFAENLPQIEGNIVELQQVVLNLITNGIQAMSTNEDEPRQLHVTTTVHDGSVELAVCDSGQGLDESLRDRMFEPFYTTKSNGTGMGLAINRTMIQAHGGRIWATSNEGRGATFRISLPINHPT